MRVTSSLFLLLLSAVACESSDNGGATDSTGDTGEENASDAQEGGQDAESDTSEGASDTATDAATDGGEPDGDEPDGDEPDGGGGADPGCWTDLAVGDKAIFLDGFTGGTEGIAFGPGGKLYVSARADGTVWAVDADGNKSPWVKVPTALGLAPSADGGMWVASIGESNAPADIDGAVYWVSAEGEAELVADGIASPNFVLELEDGSALVSDDFDTRIWRVTRGGEVSVAVEGIASPNGMGLTPERDALVVASTFSAKGEVTRIPLVGGLPSAEGWVELAQLGAASTPDGLAIGADGSIYVAANLAGKLVKVAPQEGQATVDVATGLGTPASLAFGAGPGFDPCSVYVTELFGDKIWRVSLGQPSR
jgi:sugar lactone lactonase YvrE